MTSSSHSFLSNDIIKSLFPVILNAVKNLLIQTQLVILNAVKNLWAPREYLLRSGIKEQPSKKAIIILLAKLFANGESKNSGLPQDLCRSGKKEQPNKRAIIVK